MINMKMNLLNYLLKMKKLQKQMNINLIKSENILAKLFLIIIYNLVLTFLINVPLFLL